MPISPSELNLEDHNVEYFIFEIDHDLAIGNFYTKTFDTKTEVILHLEGIPHRFLKRSEQDKIRDAYLQASWSDCEILLDESKWIVILTKVKEDG